MDKFVSPLSISLIYLDSEDSKFSPESNSLQTFAISSSKINSSDLKQKENEDDNFRKIFLVAGSINGTVTVREFKKT